MEAPRVEETWARIEAWLARNAPPVLEGLRAGANEEEIGATETALGARFPEDLRGSLRIHDGQDPTAPAVVPDGELLSLAAIREQWGCWEDLRDNDALVDTGGEPGPGVRPDWWNSAWVPLTHDGSGDHLCCDLDPADGGLVGQVIEMWHDSPERPVRAPSVAAWLASIADGLESGYLVYDAEEWGGIREDLAWGGGAP